MSMNGSITETAYHQATNRTSCFLFSISRFNGIWTGGNPYNETLPHFVIQLFAMILVTRTVYLFLKQFYITPMVADILGGIILGPSILGKVHWIPTLFPQRSIMTIDTLAYLALAFHVFLLGLWMDLKPILRTNRSTLVIVAAGIFAPMLNGICLYFLTAKFVDQNGSERPHKGCFFWGIALSITGFPAVMKTLGDLKLLHSEIGRLAIPAAVVTDLCSWVLICVAIPIVANPNNAAYIVSSTTSFILLCVYAIRPMLVRFIHYTNKKKLVYDEFYLCAVLVGVMLCAFVCDIFGTSSVVGAFVFGLIWPDRDLGAIMLERFEDFVSGILLPAFFAITGLRMAADAFLHVEVVILVLIFSCGIKVLSTFIVCYFYQINMREAVSLGVILNTKGVLALVVLNYGWDNQLLASEEYSVMVIAIVIMTAIVGPIMSIIYKPDKLAPYKYRTIQMTKPGSDLRVLACVNSTPEVHGMITLLDLMSTKQQLSTLSVFLLHLVEHTTGTMRLISHEKKISGKDTNFEDSQSDEIIEAFETCKSIPNIGINGHVLTAIYPAVTMHEEACIVAEEKRASFMILPFHQNENPGTRTINQDVLIEAPCSVGIFVDRGLNQSMDISNNAPTKQIAVIFIGGADDREALAFGWRIVSNKQAAIKHNITLIRFVPGYEVNNNNADQEDVLASERLTLKVHSFKSYVSLNGQQRSLDDDYVSEFRLRTAGEENVSYLEKLMMKTEDNGYASVEKLIREHKFDLYIVGRSNGEEEGHVSPTCSSSVLQELGVIGNFLVSSSEMDGSSVLVVQQYNSIGRVASPNDVMIDVGSNFGDSPTTMESKVNKCDMFAKYKLTGVEDTDGVRVR
ncbi:hypothetical protein ACFE04_029496 [Oxalis oulophora]